MAGNEDAEAPGPSRLRRLRERMPETGIQLFAVFLACLAAGFLLALSGRSGTAALFMLVAAASLVAMLLTPSPRALAARAARELGEQVEEGEDSEEGTLEEEMAPSGPALVAEGSAATSAARRGTPAPPPEPPSMEDGLAGVGAGTVSDAGADDTDSIWVDG